MFLLDRCHISGLSRARLAGRRRGGGVRGGSGRPADTQRPPRHRLQTFRLRPSYLFPRATTLAAQLHRYLAVVVSFARSFFLFSLELCKDFYWVNWFRVPSADALKSFSSLGKELGGLNLKLFSKLRSPESCQKFKTRK